MSFYNFLFKHIRLDKYFNGPKTYKSEDLLHLIQDEGLDNRSRVWSNAMCPNLIKRTCNVIEFYTVPLIIFLEQVCTHANPLKNYKFFFIIVAARLSMENPFFNNFSSREKRIESLMVEWHWHLGIKNMPKD